MGISARDLEMLDIGKRLGKRLGPRWDMMYLTNTFVIQRLHPIKLEWEDWRMCPWSVIGMPGELQALLDEISREHEREVEVERIRSTP